MKNVIMPYVIGKFNVWLEEQLKKIGWSYNELSKAAKLSSGTLSNISKGTRKPGPEVCTAIARALKLPPEEVFRRAGLLPERADDTDPELVHLYSLLDQRDKEETKEIIRTKLKLAEKRGDYGKK